MQVCRPFESTLEGFFDIASEQHGNPKVPQRDLQRPSMCSEARTSQPGSGTLIAKEPVACFYGHMQLGVVSDYIGMVLGLY